ncbi:MAG: substrate-binding domain-containing protein [Verrucomicrobiota bacterium]|jgi:ABC-type sugar transport system substrate-binding protein
MMTPVFEFQTSRSKVQGSGAFHFLGWQFLAPNLNPAPNPNPNEPVTRRRLGAGLRLGLGEFSWLLSPLGPGRRRFGCLTLAGLTLLAGCNQNPDSTANNPSGKALRAGGAKKTTIALLPKSKGNAYFISCTKGAQRAARDLGIDLLFDGPTDPDPARQNEIVENWITLGVDAIAAACENKDGISSALRKARAKGIKVITYDADSLPSAREFFVNQATPQGIGYILMDEAARLCHTQGEFAVITGSLTAANQSEWRSYVLERRAALYPGMKMAALRPCDDLKDKAQSEATSLLAAYPNLKLFLSTTSLGVPGAAEAVKQAGKAGQVKVIGLGLPNENRRYVKEGVTDSVILWKTEDLGYLAVQAACALVQGTLKPGAKTFKAGALGEFQVQGDNIMLGKPFIFNKDNIDQFDF